MELSRKRLISTAFTIAVVTLLYLSGPTTAISVVLGEITGTLYPGQTVIIPANITLNDYEFLMTSGSVNLTITLPDTTVVTCSLPMNTAVNQTVTCDNGMNISVTAASDAWTYDSAYGYRYGYGDSYGYDYSSYGYGKYTPTVVSSTYTYTEGYGYDYVYTYKDYWMSTSLAYMIYWTIPSTYPGGEYSVGLSVYAGDTAISEVSTSDTQNITVAAPSFNATLVGGTTYNLISIPLTLDNESVASVLSSVDGNYDIVWGYNATETNASLTWRRYRPGSGSNTLGELSPGFGYWVRVNSTTNQTLSINY